MLKAKWGNSLETCKLFFIEKDSQCGDTVTLEDKTKVAKVFNKDFINII